MCLEIQVKPITELLQLFHLFLKNQGASLDSFGLDFLIVLLRLLVKKLEHLLVRLQFLVLSFNEGLMLWISKAQIFLSFVAIELIPASSFFLSNVEFNDCIVEFSNKRTTTLTSFKQSNRVVIFIWMFTDNIFLEALLFVRDGLEDEVFPQAAHQ